MNKNFQIGLKLWSTNTGAYYEEAKRLHDAGLFHYIELYVVPDTLKNIEKWKSLEIPFTIHVSQCAHGFNLAKKENEESNFKIYQQIKQYADELDADFIIFHAGIDGHVNETAKQLKNLREVRALIENTPYKALPNKRVGKILRGNRVEEIKYIMDGTGCGFCLDFGHAVCSANSQDINPYEYINEFFNLEPKMYHLTDVDNIKSEYDSHAHIGKGQLNIDDILNKISFNSKVTIETTKDNKDNLDDFVEDLKWYKNLK